MNTDTTLRAFSNAAGKKIATVLERWTDDVSTGTIEVVAEGDPPLQSVEMPALVTAAWYGEQRAGGNLLALSMRGAKLLAARIVGAEESEEADVEELTELELSALGEATGQIMAGAAAAASEALGREIATGSPSTHSVVDAAAAETICERAEHATVYTFSLCGEPAHLVQVVPAGFLAQLRKRLADLREVAAAPRIDARGAEGSSEGAIRSVPVRVWAELGRIRMPLARAVELPPGVVVEFDCGADDPVDLFVNGRRFATGRLLVGDGRWAVEIQDVLDISEPAA